LLQLYSIFLFKIEKVKLFLTSHCLKFHPFFN